MIIWSYDHDDSQAFIRMIASIIALSLSLSSWFWLQLHATIMTCHDYDVFLSRAESGVRGKGKCQNWLSNTHQLANGAAQAAEPIQSQKESLCMSLCPARSQEYEARENAKTD